MISFSIRKQLLTAQGETALHVSCDILDEQLVTIYGASGTGKTTILRILAGLLMPEQGRVAMNGETWLDTGKKINLPTRKRNIGIVFQDYALFPNMTVRKNLEYALEKGQDKRVVDELIEIMALEQMGNRKPETLSGGQKQRVALARALVRRPQLLLLDEPLSALDNEMRVKLQDHLLTLHRHYKLTTILVSHDVPEIYKMSDKVFVLQDGEFVKQGGRTEIFGAQEVRDNMQFIGEVMSIEQQYEKCMVPVLVNNSSIVKISVAPRFAGTFKQGDKVLVFAEALNPVIRKIGL